MFSKKATKIDEIFTVDLTLCSKCQINSDDFANFFGLLRKCKLYCPDIYTVPLGMPHGAGVLILSKKSKAKERNIWVLSPLVHLKRREKYISFSQLVLFSLYFF